MLNTEAFNTEAFLFIYYVGYGFVIFLLWMCVTDPSGRAVGPRRRRRLHRLALGLAAAGVIHPVLALAGRDIGQQLGRAEGLPDPEAARTVRLTNWGLALGLSTLALVVISQLGAFEAVPVFRQIREGLPYE